MGTIIKQLKLPLNGNDNLLMWIKRCLEAVKQQCTHYECACVHIHTLELHAMSSAKAARRQRSTSEVLIKLRN